MTHRRITERPVAQGETATVAAEIAGRQRSGVIEGVEVDFRHPDLPADDWEARPFWYVWGEPPSNAGIIFPDEAAYGVAELRKMKSIDDSVPAVFALAGDKITIESVHKDTEDRRFDHAHDAERRLARLRIERPSGEVVYPAGPLAFYGTSQIRNGALRETFDHIVSRIASQSNVADLYDRTPQGVPGLGFAQFWSLSLEDMALVAAQGAHDAYFRVREGLPSDDEPDPKLGRAHLRSLVNSAALAGFLLAKAEARKAENIGAGIMRNQVKATAKRTNIGWREKASAIWQANPEWTTHRVAKDVAGYDDDISSVFRAIKKLAPSTSPSFKGG